MTKPKLPIEVHEAIWARALESEFGIAIPTNLPVILRHELLTVRKTLGHPEFDDLLTFLPEGRNEVFICHKSAELPDA